MCASTYPRTSSPDRGSLGPRSCARPRRCWASGRPSPAGSAPAGQPSTQTELRVTHVQSGTRRACETREKWASSARVANTKATPSSLLFQAETRLRTVLWRPQRREKPLFTVRRSTVAVVELPLQSVPLRLPSTPTGTVDGLLPWSAVGVFFVAAQKTSRCFLASSHRRCLTVNPAACDLSAL